MSASHRSSYSEVRLLVRNTDTPKALELIQLGATLTKVDLLDRTALDEALKDVDAVVNAVGSPHDARDKVLDAVLASNVTLYIPSEFGL